MIFENESGTDWVLKKLWFGSCIGYLLGYNNLNEGHFFLVRISRILPTICKLQNDFLSQLLCFFRLSELWRLRSSKRWLAMSKTASRSPLASPDTPVLTATTVYLS